MGDSLNVVGEPSEMHPIGGEVVDDSAEIDKIMKRAMEISIPYDSKSATGFVGIVKEKGEKAYINSLLQMLFHIPYFRKAVNHIPESVNAASTVSTLQKLFYNLEFSDRSVSKAGLSISGSSLQEDVLILCKELEDKMKGTVEKGTIRKLFEGHCNKYRNVDDENYTFSGLELDVINCKDVYASLDKYIEDKQTLEGAFTAFPPVLQLHLMRSRYDDKNTLKVNSRYEYPYQLDLDREDGKYLSNAADKSIRNLYTLHSVLVHNGGVVSSDSYFAMISPTLSEFWFKFEDEQVTRVAMQRAIMEQYGGEEEFPPFKFITGSNAIMLVYVRENERDNILCKSDENYLTKNVNLDNTISEETPAAHFVTIKVTLLKEDEKRENKGTNDETTSGIIVTTKVVRDEEQDCTFRVTKHFRFWKFMDGVAEYFGIPTYRLRFYQTRSPSSLIWPKENTKTVEEMIGKGDYVKLFLRFDVSRGASGICALCSNVGYTDIEDCGVNSTPKAPNPRVTKRSSR